MLLWAVAAAFVLGLLLFALVLLGGRDDDFYRAGDDEAPPIATTPQYTPLPAPLPADDEGASGMGDTPAPVGDNGERPRLVETAPPPPPPGPAAPTPAPESTPPAGVPTAATSDPMPLAGETPAPRYPAASLRRGETGTVLVRATIGLDGRPRRTDVARSSGSRRLDRAAEEAVRRWRFQPAMRDGQPVEAEVNVPIEFKQ
ncbi:energy transducer TonB [Marilutibacter chinensis]